MIKGKQIQPRQFMDKPVVNYRKLEALNQSMLKLFDSDPISFFEQFKLGRKEDEKKNLATRIGDLVDFYLLDCNGKEDEFDKRLDERFALFNGSKGSGQVFVLVDHLFEETKRCINDVGEITCSFETRFAEAVKRVRADEKYKGKTDEKILEDFLANGKVYFDILMENIGKVVVDVPTIDKAKLVARNLKTDEFSRKFFEPQDDKEVFTHYPIEFDFKLDSTRKIACKAEVDILIIDHEEKTIQPVDLKTTYDNESFDFMYLKNSYYLQNAFYVKAVQEWALENNLKYHVFPMIFVVGDTSINNRRPLVYETSIMDLQRGLKGFRYRGVEYRGVNKLVEDIAWAEENNEWSCSREAFENRGQMKLNIEYE